MLLESTHKLRNRIDDFKKSNQFINDPLYRQDIRMIEVMINLSELAWENKLPIDIVNYHWFKGSYLIDYDFNGEWEDISDLYSKIVDLMVDKRLVTI